MTFLCMSHFRGSLRSIAFLGLLVGLTGCASRPEPGVLEPRPVAQTSGKPVTVLAVTNRQEIAGQGGFGGEWASRLSYERYGFSVSESRDGSTIVYPATRPDPRRQYVVTARERLTGRAFTGSVTRSTEFNGTVAVFVHGYNHSYQEALFRTAQMAVDAKTIGLPILFSWPSAASVAGYVADRDAAL